MGENHQVDFAMRYDRWYRPLATALGVGPKRTIIRVDGGVLHIKHGWVFRIDVPLDDVTSAQHLSARPFAWGVHPIGNAWMVNGSREGLVKIEFARPVSSAPVRMLTTFRGDIHTLYLSLDDPDRFVAAIAANASPAR